MHYKKGVTNMTEKLKLNKEFRRLYGRGKSFVHRGFVCYILPEKSGNIRYGITAGKKLGGAVERNRAKRLITAAFREVAPRLKKGWQVVFVARSNIYSFKSYELAEAMLNHFKAMGEGSDDQ